MPEPTKAAASSTSTTARSAATTSCTPRSTHTHGWPTPNCWATNAKPPPPRSGYAPTHGSPSTASLLKKVLTDNGSCYRSHAFRDALGEIKHRRTRPYRPQTNGKVERFHRTLADEWAYARLYTSDRERCDEFPRWLHTYSHHRGHTALGGQPPATRVPNLPGQYN